MAQAPAQGVEVDPRPRKTCANCGVAKLLGGFPKTSKQCYSCKARWSAILRLFQAQHLQDFYRYVRNNIVDRGLLWEQFVEHEGKRAERLARDGTDPVFDVEEFLAARGYHFAGVLQPVPRRRVIGRPSATEPEPSELAPALAPGPPPAGPAPPAGPVPEPSGPPSDSDSVPGPLFVFAVVRPKVKRRLLLVSAHTSWSTG